MIWQDLIVPFWMRIVSLAPTPGSQLVILSVSLDRYIAFLAMGCFIFSESYDQELSTWGGRGGVHRSDPRYTWDKTSIVNMSVAGELYDEWSFNTFIVLPLV